MAPVRIEVERREYHLLYSFYFAYSEWYGEVQTRISDPLKRQRDKAFDRLHLYYEQDREKGGE